MFAKIVIAVVIVGAATALGLKSGINWSGNRGNDMGRRYMEEYGLENEKKEYTE